MPQRALRVVVAERPQSLFGRLGGESGLTRVEPGHGVQQGTVEELLVQASDVAHLFASVLEFLGGVGADAHRAGDDAQFSVPVRQQMGAAHLPQLDAVLQDAQEPIGRPHPGRVLPAHITPGRQRLQRRQGWSASAM